MISIIDIEELAASSFITECQCDSCSYYKLCPSFGPKTLIYKVWNTNFYVCFFEDRGGLWEAYYSRGECPYQNSLRRYLSFEEVFESLPDEGRLAAIFHFNILSKAL